MRMNAGLGKARKEAGAAMKTGVMGSISGAGRAFLFLQGPHGPFFHQLSRPLALAGARVLKVGFNRGDRAFWKDAETYVAFEQRAEEWPGFLDALLQDQGITDIVLYGDTRPLHAQAIQAARKSGITVHCFEEGYLRPYWATYERNGVNGHSRLATMTIDDMRAQLLERRIDQPEAPARWGDMRHHAFYGALYHAHLLFPSARYRHYRTHRETPVLKEFRLHVRRLAFIPYHAAQSRAAIRRIHRQDFVYHLGLLQLGHDSSIQAHSPIRSMPEFMRQVIEGFAAGAPPHHHLVFKAHPLEDGRFPLRRIARDAARTFGVVGRVHFVRGGKLAGLLNHARSVVTVNSTAAQQALWRGLPVRALGEAVYRKPELVSEQPLDAFFADPMPPDPQAYDIYRHYLLVTSQIVGGFYSARSRARLIRGVVDRVLALADPYDALQRNDDHLQPGARLRVV